MNKYRILLVSNPKEATYYVQRRYLLLFWRKVRKRIMFNIGNVTEVVACFTTERQAREFANELQAQDVNVKRKVIGV